MKKILITISDGMVERNLLKTEFLECLLKEKNLEVYLLADSDTFYEYLKKEYSNLPLKIILEPFSPSKWDFLSFFLLQHSIPARTVWENQRNLFRRVRGGQGSNSNINLPTFLFLRILWFLGKFKIWRLFLRFAYKMIPNGYARGTLEKIRPDLVFVPSINHSDYRIMNQAKKMGIKTLQMIKSWDNLTSKTFLVTLPDNLIVHNEIMKQEAIKLDDMPGEKIFVSGIPQFDHLVKNQSELLETREDFYKRLGIDSGKKVILYCASGDWLNPYEQEILLGIHRAIEEKKLSENLHVHIRAHPKYENKFDQIEKLGEFTIDRPFTYLSQGYKNWVFEQKEMRHWYNSIYHSEIVINTASTMSIDGAVLDKPVICIGFDGDRKLPYKDSIVRFYDRDHYANVIKTGGVSLVKGQEELVSEINLYLADPNQKKEGRETLRIQQCYKLDGQSSSRMVSFIESLLNV